MSFDAAAEAQLAGASVRPGIFFRLATDPAVRLWSGFGDFRLPPDAVEPGGAIYKGGAALGGLPALNALINGVADRVVFQLSGVDNRVLALADAEAQSVRNKLVRLAVVFFGADWRALSNVAWLWTGLADTLSVDEPSPGEGGDRVRSVSLSVGSLYTGRRRPALAFWTDPDQRRRSADDRFCERVATHTITMVKTWPRF